MPSMPSILTSKKNLPPGGRCPRRGRKRNGEMERNEKLKSRAQTLRKNMTKEEARLWYQFLCRYPDRFRRQYVIGNYIADFYCHKARLIIELDGSQHYEPDQQDKDKCRTAYFESLNLKVIRFSNLDVLGRFQEVCEVIDMEVKNRTTPLL